MKTQSLFIVGALVLPLAIAGCDRDDDTSDSMAAETTGDGDGDGDASTSAGDGDGDGAAGPVDTDGDGLTDEEEAELGTDPNLRDTDADNYWDSWELIEGTDPLDPASRIYIGWWPYNPDKDTLDQGTWETASTSKGSFFPRHSFIDQNGDYVDLYDFAYFKLNDEAPESYFIFDLSAQWCGPCHNVANWIAGVDDQNTGWIQQTYPTVREKVETYRIWWMTFIVENSAGGAPTMADCTTWFNAHRDPKIPILADEEQLVRNRFMGNAFPHFFLLNPDMTVEYFPPPSGGTDTDPYPAVGLVDKYL